MTPTRGETLAKSDFPKPLHTANRVNQTISQTARGALVRLLAAFSRSCPSPFRRYTLVPGFFLTPRMPTPPHPPSVVICSNLWEAAANSVSAEGRPTSPEANSASTMGVQLAVRRGGVRRAQLFRSFRPQMVSPILSGSLSNAPPAYVHVPFTVPTATVRGPDNSRPEAPTPPPTRALRRTAVGTGADQSMLRFLLCWEKKSMVRIRCANSNQYKVKYLFDFIFLLILCARDMMIFLRKCRFAALF